MFKRLVPLCFTIALLAAINPGPFARAGSTLALALSSGSPIGAINTINARPASLRDWWWWVLWGDAPRGKHWRSAGTIA